MWYNFNDKLPEEDQIITVYVQFEDGEENVYLGMYKSNFIFRDSYSLGRSLKYLRKLNALWTEKPNHVV